MGEVFGITNDRPSRMSREVPSSRSQTRSGVGCVQINRLFNILLLHIVAKFGAMDAPVISLLAGVGS
jgi:hypothetical protein